MRMGTRGGGGREGKLKRKERVNCPVFQLSLVICRVGLSIPTKIGEG